MRIPGSGRLKDAIARRVDLFCRTPLGVEMLLRPDDLTNRYVFQGVYSDVLKDQISALRAGDIFIDIGANAGVWSLLAASRVGDSGLVIAFEPQAGPAEDFRRNSARGGFRNIALCPFAIGPSARWIDIAVESQGHTGKGYVSYEGATIPMLPGKIIGELLDSRLDDPDSRIGIKIDVEGFELDVIKAMRSTLDRQAISFVIIECDDAYAARFGSSVEGIYSEMASLGYEPTVHSALEQRAGKHFDECFIRTVAVNDGGK